jgi:hypothetical protein
MEQVIRLLHRLLRHEHPPRQTYPATVRVNVKVQ